MKIFRFISQNIFLLIALFLIAFIPLYPKLPILDVKNTWVYIRIEDFLVAFVAFVFLVQLLRRKVTLNTPLTVPIVLFWFIGGIATLHAIIFLFPNLRNVFPEIAFLHFLRRIEYLFLFFVGFAAIRDKKNITPIIVTFAVTLLLVFVYGLGQRYLGFPAFLTMNEEFAKGIPLKLSALSRVPSTFAGHYDLAAYLILMVPFMGSMFFGYKKLWVKLFFFLTAVAGLILLMMTASRVSFAVYLISITIMLFLQKQKKFILPVIILSIVLLQSFQGLSQRFASTFTQVDLVVDARTGKPIGIAENYEKGGEIVLKNEESTGENLPQGSKFINLPNAGGPGLTSQLYLRSKLKDGSGQMIGSTGNIIVKKAFAYDVSFTTRFQGEWPRAFEAFKRNYLLGSGYSSISLATDNNYLRMLGETGLLGFTAFLGIFLFFFIYIAKVLPHVENNVVRSLAYGVTAGISGLMLNAVLIDVFEASKVAFILWLLIGITIGTLHLYQKEKIYYFREVKRVFLSLPALLIYLFIIGLFIFAPSFSNYFVADDFTWLRWAADCTAASPAGQCLSFVQAIQQYFINAQNFFYRPGTKIYFLIMFPFFELFPSMYHFVSFLLHFIASTLIFFIIHKLLGKKFFAFLGGLLFLTLSVNAEAVYWISVTGHLVSFDLMLFALLFFMYWRENQKWWLFVLILLSLFSSTLFYEAAITAPLLLIGYDLISSGRNIRKDWKKKWHYLVFLLFIPLYYWMRTAANSFWMQGDYNYSVPDIPFNVAGNIFGYILITLFGTDTLPFYQSLRILATQNLSLTAGIMLTALIVVIGILLFFRRFIKAGDLKVLLLSVLLFIVPLLPFLGLGNIAPRYVYLSSAGIVILAVYLLYRLFTAFEKKQKFLAAGVVSILAVAYMSFNVFTLQQINSDWQKAGEISNNLLTNLNLTYAAPGALPKNPVFYFVNVPMKYGDAWVFPWGLADAIWFTFREASVTVRQTNSLEDALSAKDASNSVSVFEFLPDGGVVRVNRNTKRIPGNE